LFGIVYFFISFCSRIDNLVGCGIVFPWTSSEGSQMKNAASSIVRSHKDVPKDAIVSCVHPTKGVMKCASVPLISARKRGMKYFVVLSIDANHFFHTQKEIKVVSIEKKMDREKGER
jgi:hypothetical protein